MNCHFYRATSYSFLVIVTFSPERTFAEFLGITLDFAKDRDRAGGPGSLPVLAGSARRRYKRAARGPVGQIANLHHFAGLCGGQWTGMEK